MMSSLENIKKLQNYVNQHILGQEKLITRMLIALLTDGHLLVEGVPGLAKTSAIKSMASGLSGEFHRIQFTPDLLPADLTGTEVFQPKEGLFSFQKGPLFHNFVLADEINRSPAKVQSALLEAMAERQITVGRTTYKLDDMFLVMATQNPIEQEGTYPLPEAQKDRFLMHVNISYPEPDVEQKILQLILKERASEQSLDSFEPLSREDVFAARKAVLAVHLAPELETYIVQLVAATRNPQVYNEDLAHWIAYGASTRGTISLALASKAHAWLNDRDYVSPEDIHSIAPDVLRHRILLGYDAEADGIKTDDVIAQLLSLVPVP